MLATLGLSRSICQNNVRDTIRQDRRSSLCIVNYLEIDLSLAFQGFVLGKELGRGAKLRAGNGKCRSLGNGKEGNNVLHHNVGVVSIRGEAQTQSAAPLDGIFLEAHQDHLSYRSATTDVVMIVSTSLDFVPTRFQFLLVMGPGYPCLNFTSYRSCQNSSRHRLDRPSTSFPLPGDSLLLHHDCSSSC